MGRFQKKLLEHGSLGFGSVPAWKRFNSSRFKRLERLEQFEQLEQLEQL